MAHAMKHTRAACGHMFAHFDRTADNTSNESIDRTRTHLNYNLAAADQKLSQGEFLSQRCQKVKCSKRKDLNVMVSWVVTVPQDLPEDEHKAFFQSCYDFLNSRYKKANVISAYVHMDEVTPHMHYAFVPVTSYIKKGKNRMGIDKKVCAKEVVNRHDLQTFHTDLQKYVSDQLGHEVSILNGATAEGNKSIAELKRKSAEERLQEASLKASELFNKALKDIAAMKCNLEDEKRQFEAVRPRLEQAIQEKDRVIQGLVRENKELIQEKQELILKNQELDQIIDEWNAWAYRQELDR